MRWLLLLSLPFLFGFGGFGQVIPYYQNTAGGTSYLIDFDAETAPTWDSVAVTSVCPPAAEGDYCLQDSANAINGTYSMSLTGTESTYMAKTIVGGDEIYMDFWHTTAHSVSAVFLPVLYDALGWQASLYHTSGTLRVYFNGGATVNTGIALSINTTYHFRVRIKNEVSAGDDGIVQVWYSTTDTDFDDNPTPDYENLAVNTLEDDFTEFRLRGPKPGVVTGVYDDVKVWTP